MSNQPTIEFVADCRCGRTVKHKTSPRDDIQLGPNWRFVRCADCGHIVQAKRPDSQDDTRDPVRRWVNPSDPIRFNQEGVAHAD